MGFQGMKKSVEISIFISLFFIVQNHNYANPIINSDENCFWGKKFHVILSNQLSDKNNSQPILVRCQDKTHDLGYHNLHAKEEFDWRFCNNGMSSLYFCHFWWNKQEAVFDAFNEALKQWCHNNIPGQGTHTCSWAIKDDGFYLAVDSYLRQFHKWGDKNVN